MQLSNWEWEKYDKAKISLDDFKTFLKNLADFLEAIETKISISKKRHYNFTKNVKPSSFFTSVNLKCLMSNKDHLLLNFGELWSCEV